MMSLVAAMDNVTLNCACIVDRFPRDQVESASKKKKKNSPGPELVSFNLQHCYTGGCVAPVSEKAGW